MEPLFYTYGVDIFWNGHVHSYERCASSGLQCMHVHSLITPIRQSPEPPCACCSINPVYNYNNDKCGIVHITIGDGGNQEGLSGLNYNSGSNGQDPLLHCAALPFVLTAQLLHG